MNYSTYDKEFYALVRALEHWSHYLRVQSFVLHTDYESLKYINGQKKLSPRHARWVEYLQTFDFVAKYKTGKTNIVADALSRKQHLLALLESKILGFEMIKEYYPTDEDFKEIYLSCLNVPYGTYCVQQGFLFNNNRMCIPRLPLTLLLVKESHEGSLAGHFRIQKTLDQLSQNFF